MAAAIAMVIVSVIGQLVGWVWSACQSHQTCWTQWQSLLENRPCTCTTDACGQRTIFTCSSILSGQSDKRTKVETPQTFRALGMYKERCIYRPCVRSYKIITALPGFSPWSPALRLVLCTPSLHELLLRASTSNKVFKGALWEDDW